MECMVAEDAWSAVVAASGAGGAVDAGGTVVQQELEWVVVE